MPESHATYTSALRVRKRQSSAGARLKRPLTLLLIVVVLTLWHPA